MIQPVTHRRSNSKNIVPKVLLTQPCFWPCSPAGSPPVRPAGRQGTELCADPRTSGCDARGTQPGGQEDAIRSEHDRTDRYSISVCSGSHVVVDEEADPRRRVVECRESVQELLHEGSGVFDKHSDVHQRQLLVLKHTHVKHTEDTTAEQERYRHCRMSGPTGVSVKNSRSSSQMAQPFSKVHAVGT